MSLPVPTIIIDGAPAVARHYFHGGGALSAEGLQMTGHHHSAAATGAGDQRAVAISIVIVNGVVSVGVKGADCVDDLQSVFINCLAKRGVVQHNHSCV